MSEIADRYRRLAADVTTTLQAVPADRWDAPTPCEGWSVRELAEHLVQSQGTFLGLVGLQPPQVEQDPVAAWTAASGALQQALDDPATATREFTGYTGPTTLEQSVDRFVNLDLVVHRWDLARAAGLDERLDPQDVARVHEQAQGFGDMLRMDGVCGPPVDVAADADEQTRMLAFLGRRP